MIKKLCIFYVFYDLPNKMPIHTYEVIDQFARKGHRVFLFANLSSKSEILKDWIDFDINVIKINSLPLRIIGEFSFLIHLIIKLFGYHFNTKVDIIYIRHASCSLIAALIGKIFTTPVFIEINDILIKRIEGIKISYPKRIWVKLYETLSFPLAEKIFPVTDGIKNWLLKKPGLDKDNIITIPNGVNIKRFVPGHRRICRPKFNLPLNVPVIGFLGSLFHWTGLEYLVDAAPKIISTFPTVLFVIGGGQEPYLSYLKQKVAEQGLSNYFIIFGTIEWDKASDFINTFDLCIIPAFFKSIESGISSQKVLAYLACGKPVIGSDIEGLGDMLERESIGLSFPMGNSDELAKSIIFLLNDRTRLQQMGKKAREFVVNNCSWEATVGQLQTICVDVIKHSKR
jgi:glycosyltransferase involved in cell wall biosynthesis